MPTEPSVRLQNAYTVTAYHLTLALLGDLEDIDSFHCKERIVYKPKASSPDQDADLPSTLTLHIGKDTTIIGTVGCSVKGRCFDADTITLALDQPTTDESTTSEIVLFYSGKFQPDEKGLYKATFMDGDVKKTMASTHMEPIAARNVFCCVDEPAARADFHFKLAVAKTEKNDKMTLLSGGAEEETAVVSADDLAAAFAEEAAAVASTIKASKVAEESAAFKTVMASEMAKEHNAAKNSTKSFRTQAFAVVPQVPPYLTACTMGDLTYVQETVKSRAHGEIPLRIFVASGRDMSKLAFGMTAMKNSFELLENFFDIPFPLKKLDMGLIPDFPIGGQENWGLILVYEAVLLDPETTPVAMKSYMYNLVSHEVSHNWFGNLVGIDWWEGLWLKEGFATFFGYYATEQAFPEWKPMEDASRVMYEALESDSGRATHAVEIPITHPSLITAAFDSISYNKGAALVRMLHTALLGADKFRDAIRAYMQTYQFKGTTTPQLWGALEKSSGLPVESVMNTFTKQAGFPLLTVKAITSTEISLEQEKYVFVSNPRTEEDNTTVWACPLQLSVIDLTTGADVLAMRIDAGLCTKTATFPLDTSVADALTKENTTLLVNADHTAFFTTLYPAETFDKIFSASFRKLPAATKLGLVVDTVSLIKAGRLTIDQVARFVDAIDGETETGVLSQYAGYRGFLSGLPAPGSMTAGQWTLRVAKPLITAAIALGVDKTDAAELPTVSQLRPLCWWAAIRAFESASPVLKATLDACAKANSSNVPGKMPATSGLVLEAAAFGSVAATEEQLGAVDIAALLASDDAVAGAFGLKEVCGFVQSRVAMSAKAAVSLDDPNTRAVSSAVACRYGPVATWVELYALQLDANESPLQMRTMAAGLCATRFGDQFAYLANRAMNPTQLRPSFGPQWCMNLAKNGTLAGPLLWPLFKAHFETVKATWGNGQFRIMAIVDYVSWGLDTKSGAAADEFEQFFAENALPNARLAIAGAAETARLSVALNDMNKA